jgi:hypothetical protein
MKTKIIIFILLLTVVASVYFFYKFIPRKNPSFVFENKTEFLLDSITFSTSKSCIYKKIFNIRPKSNFQDNFFFCDSIKSDGAYSIQIYHNNIIYNKVFGYYTNGTSLNNSFNITLVSLDSINVIMD